MRRLAAALLLAGCAAPESGQRHTDLLRFVPERLDGNEAPAPRVKSITVDGDQRASLVGRSPDRLELGPVPAGKACTLRFGMSLTKRGWNRSDGIEFRASILRQGVEAPLFTELLVPRSISAPTWLDRTVAIPDGDGEYHVVLSTDVGPKGDSRFDVPVWSAPHVVCTAPLRRQRPGSQPDIVLISIDTLARDRTGLQPAEHRAGYESMFAPLDDDVATVAERLAAAGYRTVAFVGGALVGRQYGLDRGFEEWTERTRANLPSMLPAVFDAIDRERDRPLFLFLHTHDVHGPYQQPVAQRYFSAEADEATTPDDDWRLLTSTPHHRYQKLRRFTRVAEVVAAYDSGVRFVDSQLGRLFDRLREMAMFDDALIIVTSDHGETLFEHRRYIGHANTLYDREVRVPLIVRTPGAVLTGRRADLVELTDLAALILDTAGLEPDSSLTGIHPTAPGEHRRLVSGASSHMGAMFARTERWKVISPTLGHWRGPKLFDALVDRFETSWQIYDLTGDPTETTNLYGALEPLPTDVERLIHRLRSNEPPGRGADVEQPPEVAERLRALGYLD